MSFANFDVKLDPAKEKLSPETEEPVTAVLIPLTTTKDEANDTLILPSSADSSPLTSIRSSPFFPFSDIAEITAREESDYERTQHLSRNCARSKSVASTRRLRSSPDVVSKAAKPSPSVLNTKESKDEYPDRTERKKGNVRSKSVGPDIAPKRKPKPPTVSAYFPKSPQKKPRSANDKVSCIPFPPLTSTSFGLVQERLSHDPFRLLIAVIFLNKTRGSVAMPVFYELMERYPTPAELAGANQEDVVDIIQHLGLQNQRAATCVNLAKAWLERPPENGKRYRVLHYPRKDDGKDVKPDEVISEEDERVAWEVGQLPGVGTYAIDSWRIFCRDELRGLPTELPKKLTAKAKEAELQKEWTRVLPTDKELRAYLRWRWLRLGWEWDPLTGQRKMATDGEIAKAGNGGVIYEGDIVGMFVAGGEGDGVDAVKAEA
ncbi:hypothetical protein MMC28_005519 [Mycoblastus sanguinarius]|nr:hypothetical protein [Mycoblastus sanguinarius]